MISRRRILSRSQEVLNDSNHFNAYEVEEEAWLSKDKLLRDHIQEILNKWDQIDDEIWAKIICMERNRRVAKAYARAPILSINGSDVGFDGYRIGLNGFLNPKRDAKTEDIKRFIGSGAKVKIDDDGNIFIKRVGKSNVYASPNTTIITHDEHSFPNEKSNYVTMTQIELDKSVKLFDMKRFQSDVYREMRNSYPDRRKLESQCFSCVAFVKEAKNILEHPVWVILINIVAMDMLKSKFPLVSSRVPKFMSIFDHPPMMRAASTRYLDRLPPKLPPRESVSTSTLESTSSGSSSSRTDHKSVFENENIEPKQQLTLQRNRGLDDLYYCGLEARIPNFARQRTSLAFASLTGIASSESRKYCTSSLMPSMTSKFTHRPINTDDNYCHEDNLESLDPFLGRDRSKSVKAYRHIFDNNYEHKYNDMRKIHAGEWEELQT